MSTNTGIFAEQSGESMKSARSSIEFVRIEEPQLAIANIKTEPVEVVIQEKIEQNILDTYDLKDEEIVSGMWQVSGQNYMRNDVANNVANSMSIVFGGGGSPD